MTGFAQLKLGLSLYTDDKPICQTLISKLLLLALLKTPQHIIFKLGAFQVGFYSMGIKTIQEKFPALSDFKTTDKV